MGQSYGQAQAFLRLPKISGQAQARIKRNYRMLANAQAYIKFPKLAGQAQANIKSNTTYFFDDFKRNTSATWGTPTNGPDYTNYVYDASVNPFNVNGSYGSLDSFVDGGIQAETTLPIQTFNTEDLFVFSPVNLNSLEPTIYLRATPASVGSNNLQRYYTVNMFYGVGVTTVEIDKLVGDDPPPTTVIDGTITWQVQLDNAWYGDIWVAHTSYTEVGSIHEFATDSFWVQSGSGLSGAVEPNWALAGPLTDGDLTWTKISITWAASTGYSNGQYIKPLVRTGTVFKALNAGTSGTFQPDWPYGDWTIQTVVDNNIRWYLGSNNTDWQPLSTYVVDDITVQNSIIWIVTSSTGAQLSGSTKPDFTVAGPITDADITWTRVADWLPSHAYTLGDLIVSTVDNGYYYFAGNSGTSAASGLSEPAFPVFWGHGAEPFIVETSTLDPVTFSDSVNIYLKIKIFNSIVYVKTWSADMAEPMLWQAQLNITTKLLGQAQAKIWRKQLYGQAQARITKKMLHGQAQALIYRKHNQLCGQAQATISNPLSGFGQTLLKVVWSQDVDDINTGVHFTLIDISDTTLQAGLLRGQAAARINSSVSQVRGQAQALIHKSQLYAQAQASINIIKVLRGQARALINNPLTPETPVVITGPGTGPIGSGSGGSFTPEDIVDLGLPGYLQSEDMVSDMDIQNNQAPFMDGSQSEYLGLTNKNLVLQMRIWEKTYQMCKDKIELAATMLRANKAAFTRLFLHDSDKYYEVLVGEIAYDKDVESSSRILDYSITFEAKPWLVSTTVNTLSGGSGTLVTTGRTIDDGGWTPTIVQLSGTDVSITGINELGDSTGIIGVTGTVTNLIVDTEKGLAYLNGEIRNDLMNNQIFGLHVGPGVTTYTVVGASSVTITYQNRWYL